MEGFLRYEFEGLIFGRAYTWRGLFSEFYGKLTSFCWLFRGSVGHFEDRGDLSRNSYRLCINWNCRIY